MIDEATIAASDFKPDKQGVNAMLELVNVSKTFGRTQVLVLGGRGSGLPRN